MKIYISVDIEGVTGVTAWEETELDCPRHAFAAKQMTNETLAACEAAIQMGATEIWVKDAHDSARNIDISNFSKEVKLIRGWTNSPESMVALLDSSFDAAIFIGYHSGAGFNGNPLAHTMNQNNNYVKINGKRIAEFDMNAFVAAYYNVPVVFVSGDEQLCQHAKELIPQIDTVAVKDGCGNATISLSPEYACEKIKAGVAEALKDVKKCALQSPDKFELEINFKQAVSAYRASFYPGAEQIDETTVRYVGKDIKEMMTARMFML